MKNAKENNVVRFSMSKDKLMDRAADKVGMGDFPQALSILHNCYRIHGADPEIVEAYIDVCEEAGLYAKAINGWFYYLDTFSPDEMMPLDEIYEGLAVDFMNLGHEMIAILYYKKMLEAAPNGETGEEVARIAQSELGHIFEQKKQPPLRLVTDDDDDYAEEIAAGVEALRKNDLSVAIDKFSSVDKKAKVYLTAGNLLALCYMMIGQIDEADRTCAELLRDHPDDLQTLATQCAIYAETGRMDESALLAKDLCQRETDSFEDLFKIATVACENGLDRQAAEKFSLIKEKMPFEKNVLYMLSVCLFNDGDIKGCKANLLKLLQLYPEAAVARHYSRVVNEYEDAVEKGDDVEMPELPYTYRLLPDERARRVKHLQSLKKNCFDDATEEEEAEIMEDLFCCFDEMDGQEPTLQALAVHTAVKIGAEPFIREIALRFNVDDMCKLSLIYQLVLRNTGGNYGFVLANLYKKVDLPKICLGRTHRKLFLSCAAEIISKYVMFNDELVSRVKTATELIYDHAVRELAMEEIDAQALKCAIYLLSEPEKAKDDLVRTVHEFGTDVESVTKLIPDTDDTETEEDEVSFDVPDEIMEKLLNELSFDGEDL